MFTHTEYPLVEYVRKLTEKHGKAWLSWLPEAVQLEAVDIIGDLPSEVLEALLAAQCLLKNNAFFTDAHAFENICLAFNYRDVDPETVQFCLPEELVVGIRIAKQIRPTTKPFSSEVGVYVMVCCDMEGLYELPEDLRFVDPTLVGPVPKPLPIPDEGISEADMEMPAKIQRYKLFAIEQYVDLILTGK